MKYPELKDKISALNERFRNADSFNILHSLSNEFPDLTLVSSFGAEAAVLLHLVSRVDPNTPVVFIDTGKLFKETLDYKNTLQKEFGLTNIKIFEPDPEIINKHDPLGIAHMTQPDSCCFFRKTKPLSRALQNITIWLSGRKRYQSLSRANIQLFELSDMRIKVNPLADWTIEDIRKYRTKYNLPAHPLLKDNFLSIGCMPCTTAVKDGEDQRSGRWRGQDKIECGIHSNAP